MNNSENLLYFLAYLRKKIVDGEKQVDIAKAIGKSTSYINSIYKKVPKNCPIKTQRDVALYFNLSHENLLSEGKVIYERDSDLIELPVSPVLNRRTERRSQEPDAIVSQLSGVIASVIKNRDSCKLIESDCKRKIKVLDRIDTAVCAVSGSVIEYQNTLHMRLFGFHVGANYFDCIWASRGIPDAHGLFLTRGEIEITRQISDKFYLINARAVLVEAQFDSIVETVTDVSEFHVEVANANHLEMITNQILPYLDEGVTFFDAENNLVFSSNRWGVLDGVDLSKKPSLDELMLMLRNKISDFDAVLDTVEKAQSNNKEHSLNVSFKGSDRKFRFRIIPLLKEREFMGTIIINAPFSR